MSDETEILTENSQTSHVKPEPVQRGSQSGEKQACPRRAPGGVPPRKSDTSPSSAFLLIKASSASPAASLIPPITFHFISLSTLLWKLSVLPSCHSDFPMKLPETLVLTPQPHFHFGAVGRQRDEGDGKCFLGLNSCCRLRLSTPPLVRLKRQSSVLDGGLFTLTENYTRQTVWFTSHVASLFFSQK